MHVCTNMEEALTVTSEGNVGTCVAAHHISGYAHNILRGRPPSTEQPDRLCVPPLICLEI